MGDKEVEVPCLHNSSRCLIFTARRNTAGLGSRRQSLAFGSGQANERLNAAGGREGRTDGNKFQT